MHLSYFKKEKGQIEESIIIKDFDIGPGVQISQIEANHLTDLSKILVALSYDHTTTKAAGYEIEVEIIVNAPQTEGAFIKEKRHELKALGSTGLLQATYLHNSSKMDYLSLSNHSPVLQFIGDGHQVSSKLYLMTGNHLSKCTFKIFSSSSG